MTIPGPFPTIPDHNTVRLTDNHSCEKTYINAFALTGREIPRYTRLPRVPLRLPWSKRSLGFQPVVPDDPGVPDCAHQTGHPN